MWRLFFFFSFYIPCMNYFFNFPFFYDKNALCVCVCMCVHVPVPFMPLFCGCLMTKRPCWYLKGIVHPNLKLYPSTSYNYVDRGKVAAGTFHTRESSHDCCSNAEEASADVLAKKVVLPSLCRNKLDCCVFWTLEWHHWSRMEYMATICFHCTGTEFFPCVKLQKGFIDWEKSPKSPST